MRVLNSQLASSISSSVFISDSPITSDFPVHLPVLEGLPDIATPKWNLAQETWDLTQLYREILAEVIKKLARELTVTQAHLLAHDGTISWVHAQMVIQNLHLMRLTKALKIREKVKEKDICLQLFLGGFGWVLTEDNFLMARELAEVERRQMRMQSIIRRP